MTKQTSNPRWPFVSPPPALPRTLPDGRPWPRISVVTASLNQERFLEQNLLSVLNQDYPNVEHLIVDVGSTDLSLAVIEKYRAKLAYVVSDPDQRLGHALNLAFARATGEILVWLAGDDQLTAGSLAAAALAFWQFNPDLVAGACELQREGQVVARRLTGHPNGPFSLGDLPDLGPVHDEAYMPRALFFTRGVWQQIETISSGAAIRGANQERHVRLPPTGARLHVVGRTLAKVRVQQQQAVRWSQSLAAEQLAGAAEKLRVALFNDVGFRFGAGIAHKRLAECLTLCGHEVHSICALGDDLTRHYISAADVVKYVERIQPDIVVLGNLHGADVDPETVGRLAERWPTYQVLHDFWMLTGRCVHAGDCTRYQVGCDSSCPTAEEYPALPRHRIHTQWCKKRTVLSARRSPVLLANSGYTFGTAEKMLPQTNRPDLHQVALGVPEDVFRPRDRTACRKELGLPLDKFILLFSACSLRDRRKGFRFFLEAIKRLAIPNLHLVCLGDVAGIEEVISDFVSFGYVDDPQTLARIYSAADLYVGPNLEETFGQTFIEAAACGTPSVAFRLTGVADAVHPGVTGVFAERVSSESLAAAIQQLYEDVALRMSMGVWGRLYIENERSLSAAGHRFHEVLRRTAPRFDFQLSNAIYLHSRPVGVSSPCPWASVGRGAGSSGVRLVHLHSGFLARESPDRQLGVSQVQRAVGRDCLIKVDVDYPGRYLLSLSCVRDRCARSFSVTCDGRRVGVFRLRPVKQGFALGEVHIDLPLRSGVHDVELHFDELASAEDTARKDQELLVAGVSVKRHFPLFGKKSLLSQLFKKIHRRKAA